MNRYTPHPIHQIFPILFIVIASVIAVNFPSGYMVIAFIVACAISLLTGIWIAIAGSLDKYTEYWTEVNKAVRKLENTDPAIRNHAMGKTSPPQSIVINENVTGQPGESTYYAFKTFDFPVTPEEMQIIADGILSGAKTFVEGDWTNTQIGQTKIRMLKHDMLNKRYLVKSGKNSNSTFVPTRKGWLVMYHYCSDWVKELSGVAAQFQMIAANTPSEQVDVT